MMFCDVLSLSVIIITAEINTNFHIELNTNLFFSEKFCFPIDILEFKVLQSRNQQLTIDLTNSC